MILKNLKLKNYRRFKELNIDFDENIIAFIGSNGSGKSTVFESILYALYGTNMARSAKEEIRSDFAEEDEVCEVSITFELEGKEYKVDRKIKGKNHTTEAFVFTPDGGEQPVAERESGVNEFIKKLIGMDATTFKISVFSAQKELDKFSSLRPEERKTEIRRLLNIDVIKEAINLLRKDARENESKAELLNNQLVDLKELKDNKKTLQEELKEANKHKEVFSKSLEEKKQSLDKQITKVTQLQKTYEEYGRLEKEISNCRTKHQSDNNSLELEKVVLKNLEAKSKELELLQSVKKEYENIKKTKELLDVERDRYNKKENLEKSLFDEKKAIEETENTLVPLLNQLKELEGCEDKLKVVHDQIKTLTKKKSELSHKLGGLEKEGKAIQDKIDETNKKLHKIKQLGKDSECPTCTQILGEYYEPLVSKFNEDVTDLKNKLEAKRNEFKAIRGELETLNLSESQLDERRLFAQTQVDTYGKLATHKKVDEENLKKQQMKVGDMQKAIESIGKVEFNVGVYEKTKSRYLELESEYQKVVVLETEIKRITEVKNKILLLRNSLKETMLLLDEYELKQAKLGFDKGDYKKQQDDKESLQSEYSDMREQFSEIKGTIDLFNSQLENTEKDLKRQEILQREIKELLSKTKSLRQLEPILVDFEKDLLVRIRPILEQESSQLLQIITQGKYSAIELDQDYDTLVFDKGSKYKIRRFSGGEEDLINLCLRLAISRVISDRAGGSRINFLILDEVFSSQDEGRQENIIKALQGLSTQFRQLFLITHVTSLKDRMPIIYQVTEKNRDLSEVVLVS